jgi:hypothetical protein
VFHTQKLLGFPIPPNAGEKLLADRRTHSTRIEVINIDPSVPKKNKIVQSKNEAPPEAGGSSLGVKAGKSPRARRVTTNRKTQETSGKESATAKKTKVSMPTEAGGPSGPLDEEIRIRAYFISERRRRFALPGDADSDWLEAKRQLLSESGPR